MLLEMPEEKAARLCETVIHYSCLFLLQNITSYSVAPLGSQVREGVCEGGSRWEALYTHVGETAPALRSQNISANQQGNIMVSSPQ